MAAHHLRRTHCSWLLGVLLLAQGHWCSITLAQAPAAVAADQAAPFYADKNDLLVYRDPDGEMWPVESGEEWQVRRRHILANMQQVMGPLPGKDRRCPLDVKEEAEFDHPDGYRRLTISFSPEPGDRLEAYLLIPTVRRARSPAMLCLHQTTSIGKDEPAGLGGADNLHYAAELAARGYVTLAVDYPNFGTYQFDPYEHGYASATMKGIWNHIRAVDLLCSRLEVDPERIGVIGHSLGGHNSLFVAAFDQRLKCVVTSCGFNSFPQYKHGDLTGWSHRGYMPRIAERYDRDPKQMPFDFTEVLAAMAPRAVFVSAPQHDANFAIEGVRQCVTAAWPVYELFEASEQLHTHYPDAAHDFPPESRQRAYKWLDEHLGR